jgi:hypothetical protein
MRWSFNNNNNIIIIIIIIINANGDTRQRSG